MLREDIEINQASDEIASNWHFPSADEHPTIVQLMCDAHEFVDTQSASIKQLRNMDASFNFSIAFHQC